MDSSAVNVESGLCHVSLTSQGGATVISRRADISDIECTLAALVSHDLRNPLTSIAFSLELLFCRSDLPEEVMEEVGVLKRNTERLLRVINNVLHFERLRLGREQLHFRKTPLSLVVKGAIECVQALAKSRRINMVCPERDCEVDVDRDALMRVFINLLSNAIAYSPEEGLITIAIQQMESFVEVTISDQGPGVPEAAVEAIFEPLRRLDEGRGGIGLGLSICKLIIEKHEGNIGVRKNATGGSTFWFRIASDLAADLAVDSAADSVARNRTMSFMPD